MLVVRRLFGLLARKAHIGDGCFIACLCVVPGWARRCTACGCLFHGESVCGPLSRHGAWADCVRRRYPPCHAAAAPPTARRGARYRQQRERQSMTPIGWATRECRMQFPQHRIAPRVHIGGIATFVDTVESSLNRIACETAPSERTRVEGSGFFGPFVVRGLF